MILAVENSVHVIGLHQIESVQNVIFVDSFEQKWFSVDLHDVALIVVKVHFSRKVNCSLKSTKLSLIVEVHLVFVLQFLKYVVLDTLLFKVVDVHVHGFQHFHVLSFTFFCQANIDL